MTSSGGGQSQWCARIWLWGPVAGAPIGELIVAGAQVVGRPRKAAKAKTNNGSLLKLMSIELVMLSNIWSCAALLFVLQSFPASGYFPVSWLFASGGQSIGVSASSSVLSINIQGWFPLGLTGLISLLSKGFSKVFSSPMMFSWFENINIGDSLLLLLSHFGRVWLCATPWTAAHQAPLSLGFSRQEHWSGLPFPSPMHESEKWNWSRSVVSNSSRPHGLQPTRLLRPWDFPGKSTGVGCHCLLWGSVLVSFFYKRLTSFPSTTR